MHSVVRGTGCACREGQVWSGAGVLRMVQSFPSSHSCALDCRKESDAAYFFFRNKVGEKGKKYYQVQETIEPFCTD